MEKDFCKKYNINLMGVAMYWDLLDKKVLDQLAVNFSSQIRSVDLMDKFDGVFSDEMYFQLVLKYYHFVSLNKTFLYHIVIERAKPIDKFEGLGITFTELKRKKASDLEIAVSELIKQENVDDYVNRQKVFYFKKPILFRAQNSFNRSGYGQIWDWSIDKENPMSEGTQYGETTNYKIVGVYLISF
jgi:hypothetical protein